MPRGRALEWRTENLTIWRHKLAHGAPRQTE